MSQDWNAPVAQSDSLATARTTVNDALEALRTLHSGTTAPTSTVAYMLWADTTDGILKIRNAADDGWVHVLPLTELDGGAQVHQQAGWITHSSTMWTGEEIPAGYILLEAHMHVVEEFDSDGTNLARGGHAGDDDAFFTDEDVSTTGVKTLTSGAELKNYSGTARTPQAKYTPGGSAATTGKALVVYTYAPVPTEPA